MQISTRNMKKSEIHFSFAKKMLTIFGWNFEIWAVQKYVVDIFIISFSSSVLFSQKTHKCKSCRSRQKLSNKYSRFIFKIGVDAA